MIAITSPNQYPDTNSLKEAKPLQKGHLDDSPSGHWLVATERGQPVQHWLVHFRRVPVSLIS